MITKEAELELVLRAKGGDKSAMAELVHAHHGWIWQQANRYAKNTAAREDFFQEAAIGFIMAVEGFDPNFGTRFLTYATKQIEWKVKKYRERDRLIRIPGSANYNAISEESRELARNAQGWASLNVEIHDGGDFQQPDDKFERHEEGAKLRAAIKTLKKRERAVIRRRMRGETSLSIANRLGISRQAVHQIESRVKNRLKKLMSMRNMAKSLNPV